MRKVRSLVAVWTIAFIMVFAVPKPASATSLTINATFSGLNGGLSAAAQAVINSAIGFYQTTFSDPITVAIEFHNMTTGLGASSIAPLYTIPYSTYRTALLADSTSTDDATALAFTPAGAVNPVNGTGFIDMKSANGRAVGLNTPGLAINITNFCNFTGDGCIGLNVSNTTTGGGLFSLLATTQHEIDEVLGLGSALAGPSQGGSFDDPWTEDLFRWAAPTIRSFSTNLNAAGCANGTGAPAAFFSINGGTTNLNQFNNCNNGGDYGDWITHSPSQVQDAFTNGTGNPSLALGSSETVALDVIGYTRTVANPVPEPTSLELFAATLVFAAITRRRRFLLR